MKKIFGGLLFIIIAIIIIVISIDKIKKHISIEKGKETIGHYLDEYFGSNNSKEMIITFVSYDDGRGFLYSYSPNWLYEVSTPLLQDSFNITLDEHCEKIVSTSFSQQIIKEKNLTDEFNKQLLRNMPPLPKNVTFSGFVTSVNNNEYYEGNYSLEDLLNRCNYVFEAFTIKMEQYDKGQAIAIVKDLYVDYYEELNKYFELEDRMKIYIQVRTNRFEKFPYEDYVHGTVKKINSNQIEIEFGAYTFEGGNKSIEEFTEIISIDQL